MWVLREGGKEFCGEGWHRAVLVAIFFKSGFKIDLSLARRQSGQASALTNGMILVWGAAGSSIAGAEGAPVGTPVLGPHAASVPG